MMKLTIEKPKGICGWYHLKLNGLAVGQLKVDFLEGNVMLCISCFQIKKKYRGNGYGRSLLNTVLIDLKETGHPYFLACQPKNKIALNLYLTNELIIFDKRGQYDEQGIKWLFLIPKGHAKIIYSKLRFKKNLLPKDKDKKRKYSYE